MTTTGEHRTRYSIEVEARPSRFAAQGTTYRAWRVRADAHMF